MSNVSKVFQQLLKILDEAGVSPDRVGQIETEEGTLYEDSAPITFVDEEGVEVIIKTDGSIWTYGQKVGQMQLREDAWYQAQEMIWLASMSSEQMARAGGLFRLWLPPEDVNET